MISDASGAREQNGLAHEPSERDLGETWLRGALEKLEELHGHDDVIAGHGQPVVQCYAVGRCDANSLERLFKLGQRTDGEAIEIGGRIVGGVACSSERPGERGNACVDLRKEIDDDGEGHAGRTKQSEQIVKRGQRVAQRPGFEGGDALTGHG